MTRIWPAIGIGILLALPACGAVAQSDAANPVFAALSRPASGEGRFPAMVLSHTCSGLGMHVHRWSHRLVGEGYVVLVLNHLKPRGITNNCPPSNPVSVTEYAKDAAAALKHLQTLPYVDPRRIGQMGFSYGAMAGLRLTSESFRKRSLGGDEGFRAVVAFYPWCNERTGTDIKDHQWNFHDDTNTPLLLLLGAKDNEANPRSCVDRARKNAERGLPVHHLVLPDATHAFDIAEFGDRTIERPRGVVYRYNAEATERAWREAREFLRRHVKGEN